MQNIEEILSKHFAGESNPQEEAVVAQWKTEHHEEYEMLFEAWSVSSELKVKEYDADAALRKIEPQLQQNTEVQKEETKVFELKRFLRYAVAACAVVLIGLGAVWYLSTPGFVVVDNTTAELMEIDLEDGSKVTLAPNSTLEYQEEFKESRNIRLKGEAYFDVARDEKHPFVIATTYGDIEVLGTAFNVDASEENTHVFVDHGKVAVKNNGKEVLLTKGQEAISTENELSPAEQTDNTNIMSWRTGYFVFEETPITEAVEELNTYYSKQIILESENKGSCLFNGHFDQRPLEELIEIIVLTCGVEAEYGENTIRLK